MTCIPSMSIWTADPEVEGGGFNPGCVRNGVVLYREGQKWRRKALAELKRRPAWVAEWLADAEMDRRVEELCAAKGLSFAPHECPPWWVRSTRQSSTMTRGAGASGWRSGCGGSLRPN